MLHGARRATTDAVSIFRQGSWVDIHAGEFIATVPSAQITDFMLRLRKVLLLKVGEDVNPGGMAGLLGRTKRRLAGGMFTLPSEELMTSVMARLGLTGAKPVRAPLDTMRPQSDDHKELSTEQSRAYRSFVGNVLYAAKDRPELRFAATAAPNFSRARPSELETGATSWGAAFGRRR